MSHVRQQIRDAVATRLTGLPTTGNAVYKMRKYALDDAKLPALCVYTGDETSALLTIGLRTLRRVNNIVVEGYCKGPSTSVYDSIDIIAMEVEEAIGSDFTLGGLAKSMVLVGTEVDVNVQGETSIASVKLVYAVEYITSIGDVETAR